MATFTTFRAIINVPKAQLVGSANHKPAKNEGKGNPNNEWIGAIPLYKSEIEVTRAIASGTFQPCERAKDVKEAYVVAKEYEKWLKKQRAFIPFGKKAASNSRNGKYVHVMFR